MAWFLTSGVPAHGGSLTRDWPYVGQNLNNDGNQRLERQIATDNAAELTERWRFGVATGPGGAGISGQPTISYGVAYFADANGVVHAVDAKTGTLIWQTTIPGAQFVTSPTITNRFLYIAESEDLSELTLTAPGRIFCIDRENGAIVWEAPLDPSTLGSVIPDIPVSFLAYGGDTAVIDDYVIVGVASIENSLAPGDNTFRGSVVAFNRFTGEELWRLYTTDDQASPMPEFGAGGGVWSSPAIDRQRKLLFIGTGQAYECPSQFTECPPSEFEPGTLAGPLTDSLLAVDYRTGELIWHKQFTQDDVWGANTGLVGRDFDVGAHPDLFSVLTRLPGDRYPRRHDLVGVGDKGGRYYILERARDQGPTSEDIRVLATLQLDPGGSLGTILSTAAYDAGVLYIASNAKIVEGRREAPEIFDVLSLPTAPAADFSTKIVAIDVRKLLEGTSADEYTLWSVEENPDEVEGLAQIPGLTTAPLTIANGVLYHASSTGYFRGLDAGTGVEIFRRTPLEFDRADLGGTVAVPLLAGVTIVNGQVFVAAGTSQFALADGQPSAVVAYGLPKKLR
jgi:outer membrane protein assembly factor BamB